MATYAISDIHGCFDELQDLLELIAFGDDDTLYVLGDLIDRGPRNDACVKWIVQAPDNVVYMLGNHEKMMVDSIGGAFGDFVQDPTARGIWCDHGGQQTFDQCKKHCTSATMEAFQSKVEKADVLATLAIGGRRLVIVHAGVVPPASGNAKSDWTLRKEDALLWNAGTWYEDMRRPPFDAVFGHVPTKQLAQALEGRGICPEAEIEHGNRWHIMNWNGKWAIDCGCAYGGKLAALRLDDYEAFYVPCRQADGYFAATFLKRR